MLKMATMGCALVLLASSGSADDQKAQPIIVNVNGSVDGASTSLSGIDCTPMTGGRDRICLIALDEGLKAQWALFSLEPTPTLTFLHDDTVTLFDDSIFTDEVRSEIPIAACRDGEGKLNENDSEGVSFFDNQFFVTGSHGCGRKGHKFKRSQFIDVRVPPRGADGKPDPTARLNKLLRRLPFLGSSYGQDLDNRGISIEGIAATKDRLFFGLRSPVPNEEAAILSVDKRALFSKHDPLAEKIYSADLSGFGVRDLAVLDTDPVRLLALGGGKQGEKGNFAIFVVTLATDSDPTQVSKVLDLSVEPGEKAEGMMIADRDGKKVKVLVLHDGPLPNGNPVLYSIQIP